MPRAQFGIMILGIIIILFLNYAHKYKLQTSGIQRFATILAIIARFGKCNNNEICHWRNETNLSPMKTFTL